MFYSRTQTLVCFTFLSFLFMVHAVRPPLGANISTNSTSNANHISNLPLKDERIHVPPLNALFCLIILALNAATQRSGADHFANEHLSPARTSPFICLADILVTILWLGYGMIYLGHDFKTSAWMLFKDFGFSKQEDRLSFGKLLPFLLVVSFMLGALFEGIKLFAFAATGTAPWLQSFAAAMFVAAYIVRVAVNTASRFCKDDQVGSEIVAKRPDRKQLYRIADVFYNLAYSAQFYFWIDTFRKLDFFAEPKWAVVATVLITVATLVCVSWFCPAKETHEQPNTTGLIPPICMERWSLKNWKEKDWNKLFLVLFIQFINVPFGSVWSIDLVPLAAFAVAVGHLFVVSFLGWLGRRAKAKNGTPIDPAREVNDQEADDPNLPEEDLQTRDSPLLRTKTPEWRNTVSLTFGAAGLTFACVYYFSVYDASKTVKPSLFEAL